MRQLVFLPKEPKSVCLSVCFYMFVSVHMCTLCVNEGNDEVTRGWINKLAPVGAAQSPQTLLI